MKSKLLLLLLIPLIGLSKDIKEYRLLKKFIETGNIELGLYILKAYPEAVFIDDLKVMLAENLLKTNAQMARNILRSVRLPELSDFTSDKVYRVWRELGLDLKPLAIRFPEKFKLQELQRLRLSKAEKGAVLKRLMREREYKKVALLTGNEFCYIKGKALFRLKDYREAYSVLKGCKVDRAHILALKSLIRLGRFREAEIFVRKHTELKLTLAKAFFFDRKFEKAKKLLAGIEASYGKFFYLGLIDFIHSRYKNAVKRLSKALRHSQYPHERAQANFWLYKSLTEIGNISRARAHLKRASREESFYGTVARRILGRKVWSTKRLRVPYRERAKLSYRLKSIKELGFLEYMRREAKLLEDKLSMGDILLLSRIDPYTAVKIAVRRFGYGSEVYKAVAFPTPFRKLIEEVSEEFGVEEALIYAIMRQESLFDTRAVSVSGATGLMQLMPSTARWQAGKLGIDSSNLFNPRINITLGVAYLRYLKEFWKGDLLRIVASYNAGEGAVKRWKHYRDDFLFIETIPYDQTRKYVKKVLRNYYVYSEILR